MGHPQSEKYADLYLPSWTACMGPIFELIYKNSFDGHIWYLSTPTILSMNQVYIDIGKTVPLLKLLPYLVPLRVSYC